MDLFEEDYICGICLKPYTLCTCDSEDPCTKCPGLLSCLGCPHNDDTYEKDFNNELGKNW